MAKMELNRQEEYLNRIDRLKLMDDDFFSEALDGKVEAVEFILQVVLERDDLKVIETKEQVEYKSATKRSIRLDYSIVSIDSVKAEKNSGWTCVDNVATVNGDILYSNQRREAVIPVTYQASIGSGLEPQECLILLDLSQEH